MKILTSALSFFTIIRLPGEGDLRNAAYGAAIAGLLIGGCLALVTKTTGNAAPFLMVAYLAVITGFLHLDGLADTFDAFFSHRPKEKMLEIMKESRTGVMGACALILCLLGKYHAFQTVDSLWLLIAIPSLSRFLGVAAGAVLPYARQTGLGSYFITPLSPLLFLQLIPAELILLFAAGPLVFMAINLFAGALFFILILWHKKMIGGITGDGMGAVIEIAETALFLLISCLYIS